MCVVCTSPPPSPTPAAGDVGLMADLLKDLEDPETLKEVEKLMKVQSTPTFALFCVDEMAKWAARQGACSVWDLHMYHQSPQGRGGWEAGRKSMICTACCFLCSDGRYVYIYSLEVALEGAPQCLCCIFPFTPYVSTNFRMHGILLPWSRYCP